MLAYVGSSGRPGVDGFISKVQNRRIERDVLWRIVLEPQWISDENKQLPELKFWIFTTRGVVQQPEVHWTVEMSNNISQLTFVLYIET